jgi:acetyl coenzyme A synthetase (ADP forming)-like protein
LNLNAIFHPNSVAIIGASKTPGKIGYILTNNMLNSGFKGKIYPVNPGADEILGLKCYPSVLDIPGDVDLSVITIPSASVLQAAEECGKKGVKALVVISAGFKETGHEGSLLEQQLVEIGKRYGMRIQGPNCLGLVITTTPLNLSFAVDIPRRGKIGFISQSGALGTAVLDWVTKENIGFHSFISLGNKADLDEIDFLEAMSEDNDVSVILLYLESIEEGRRFLEASTRVVKKKPVVVLKGGTSSAGARAAGSHTGALVGSFLAYQTAFNKAGVILANSIEELFDYGLVFMEQPLPKDEGIALITNAGGPGILATDLSEKLGVKISSISSEVQGILRKYLPPASATGNPIDVLGDAKADRYAYALQEVVKDDGVNAIIVLLTPQAMTESLETAKNIVSMKPALNQKPILAVFMGGKTVEEATRYLMNNGVPCFDFPEKAIQAISAMYRYTRFLKLPIFSLHRFDDVDSTRVKTVINAARTDNRVVLLSTEAADLVEAYGIPVPKNNLAVDADEAVKYAEKLSYPVVLRIVSPDILHKTDVGGVALNLTSSTDVRTAFDRMMTSVNKFIPHARIYGVMVYHMIPRGREMIIGMSKDLQFGPLLMFGLGGIYVNFLKDVSFRLAPLTENEASEMMEDTKAYTLLKGIRGEDPSDLSALKDMILRVSQLVSDFPEIVEMDINPVVVYKAEEGAYALDVKITLSK